MTFSPPSRNPFFPLVAGFSVLFIVTIFALVAAQLGDPDAPVNRLLDAHAEKLLVVEVIGILTTGFLALVVDRRQTLRNQASQAANAETAANAENSDDAAASQGARGAAEKAAESSAQDDEAG